MTEQVLLVQEPHVITYSEFESYPLDAGDVRVRTLYSGISAGTEMTIYRGSNPYGHKHWDADLKLFLPAGDDPRFYPAPLGYEQVGYISETSPDVSDLHVGDVLYGSWGHRTEAILPARNAAPNCFRADSDPRQGIFARSGAIALNGVLDAQINVGEGVAVFGAGVIGLLVMALARLSGARVIGVDNNVHRLSRASTFADELISADPAVRIKEETRGRGADVAIEATGNDVALNEAIRSVAYSGRVVSLGFYQNNAKGLYLGEEFHHNRVQIICSQIGGVNPQLSYRWNIMRLENTIMALQEAERLKLLPLITQEIPFSQAASAYRLLDEYADSAIQVVLTFPDAIRDFQGRRQSK